MGAVPDTGAGAPNRPQARSSGRLSSQQRAEFVRQGYLVVGDVLPVSELAALDAEFEDAYRERIADPAVAADDQRRNQIHQLGTDSESSRRLACDPAHPQPGGTPGVARPGVVLGEADLEGPPRAGQRVPLASGRGVLAHLRRQRTAHVDLAAAAEHAPPQRLPARGAGQSPPPRHPTPAALPRAITAPAGSASCPASGSCATRCIARYPPAARCCSPTRSSTPRSATTPAATAGRSSSPTWKPPPAPARTATSPSCADRSRTVRQPAPQGRATTLCRPV